MSTWNQRVCAKCEEMRPKSAYTKKQWEKGRNISRCARCVHGSNPIPASAPAPAPAPAPATGPEAPRPDRGFLWHDPATGDVLAGGSVEDGAASAAVPAAAFARPPAPAAGARTGAAGSAPPPPPSPAPLANASRQNRAVEAFFPDSNLRKPFGSGSTMVVAMGFYTAGPRKGEPCVAKWADEEKAAREGVTPEEVLDAALRCSAKALEIVNLFNQEGIAGQPIVVSIPERWTIEEHPLFPGREGGVKCLLEPFIEDWQKFNLNNGKVFEVEEPDRRWSAVMQALSHFSYHVTGGQMVLCDLQGGIYGNAFVLADPAIVSRVQGAWGVTDMGPEGIEMFFRGHLCNGFCRSHWTMPRV